MAKKSKQPSVKTASEPATSASTSVFEKLFGDVSKVEDSIFTDHNPFRRRKVESLPPEPQVQPQVISEDENLLVKTKRKKDGKELADDEVLAKEQKKENKIVKVDGDGERKKRKRDELEKEYEKRVFGAVVEEVGEKEIVGKKRKKDASAEMTVEKEEGFDDESKLLRTVFVGNLPLKMKKKTLIKEFSQFGEVESVRIRSVPIIDVGVIIMLVIVP